MCFIKDCPGDSQQQKSLGNAAAEFGSKAMKPSLEPLPIMEGSNP